MRKLLMTIVASALLCISADASEASASTVWASWYGPGFHGRKTASGERFNQNAFTAAHKSLPFGTVVAISYKGRTIHVRINDRGPFIKGRSIDLSKAAARAIGCPGVCKVTMQVITSPKRRHGKSRKKRA